MYMLLKNMHSQEIGVECIRNSCADGTARHEARTAWIKPILDMVDFFFGVRMLTVWDARKVGWRLSTH